MKKLIVMAILAVMGLQAQAQIVSSRSSMVTREVIGEDKVYDYKGWSTFGIEYLPSQFSYDGGDETESFTGLALNYTNAISLTQSMPFFLEWGIGAQYSFRSESKHDTDYKMNMISAKIPINLIYDIAMPNSTIHIDPFVGVKFRGNIWGQEKIEYGKHDEKVDLFDSDEGDCNRFQVGLQAGVKVRFTGFFIGAGYGIDFSEFSKKTKINEWKIMLGLVF